MVGSCRRIARAGVDCLREYDGLPYGIGLGCSGLGRVSGLGTCVKLGVMEVTFVKADGPGEQDRVYLTMDGAVRRGPVHVVHDLPHLVVESVFGIDDGLWAELEAGHHAAAARAMTARDPKRKKTGRIVSGAAEGVPTSRWLTAGHRRAKVLTNAVANRFGDGPDTPTGVRERVAHSGERAAEEILSEVHDDTVTEAISGVAELLHRWEALPAGEPLRLTWPPPRSYLAKDRGLSTGTESPGGNPISER